METPIASLLMKLAELMARAVDFPFSPVRLVLLALPPETTEQTVAMVRAAAGIAYVVGILGVIAFGVLVRIYGWPVRYGAFNVWINLPLFDPTGGGDVLTRLKRDAVLNLVLGFLLPFLLPAFVKLAGALIDINIGEAHTLVWVMTIWAFVPANLMIRGIALYRVADIIEEKRRRTYAEARSDDGMQIA